MGTYAHTNVGNATARTMYASAGQVQDSTLTYLTSVSGTNAITASAPIVMTAYATGQTFRFIAANATTGAVTININSIGLKSIVRTDGSALVSGDIASGAAVQIMYDGTNFQLLSDANGSSETMSTLTVTGNTYLATSSGNVGIGNSSPAFKLDVTGQIQSSSDVRVKKTGSDTVASGPFFYLNSGDGSNNGNIIQLNASNGLDIWNSIGGSYTKKLTLDTSGRLGIGTASPSAPLTFAPSTGRKVGFYQGTEGYSIGVEASNFKFVTDASAVFTWANGSTYSSATEYMRLDSSGNLGLGVTPSAWQSTRKAYQVLGSSLSAVGNNTFLGNNFYSDGTSRYIATAFAQLYSQESDGGHKWYTAPSGTAGNAITFTQAMTLNASGSLLVGTTNSVGSSIAASGSLTSIAGGFLNNLYFSGGWKYADNGFAWGTYIDSGSYVFVSAPNNSSGFAAAASPTERMRIDSSGRLGVGASNPTAQLMVAGVGGSGWTGGGRNTIYLYNTNSSANQSNFITFGSAGLASACFIGNDITADGTTRNQLNVQAGASGGVFLGNTATAWASASDERLKNVTGTYTNALADIAKIKPIKFTWKSDEDNKPQVGVVAQSVEDVVPEAVTKGRMSAEDETEYLSVKYTELIPLLIASIQELKTEFEEYKASHP
jgi:hypothetical protein